MRVDDTISSRAGFGGAEIIDNKSSQNQVSYSLSGRWCAPHKFIELFADRFNLSGQYTDAESGCNFFHVMKFKDGKKIFDEEENYFSDLSIEHNDIECYVEEYEWIAEEEDWEDNNDELLALFKKHGYSIDKLKYEWS